MKWKNEWMFIILENIQNVSIYAVIIIYLTNIIILKL